MEQSCIVKSTIKTILPRLHEIFDYIREIIRGGSIKFNITRNIINLFTEQPQPSREFLNLVCILQLLKYFEESDKLPNSRDIDSILPNEEDKKTDRRNNTIWSSIIRQLHAIFLNDEQFSDAFLLVAFAFANCDEKQYGSGYGSEISIQCLIHEYNLDCILGKDPILFFKALDNRYIRSLLPVLFEPDFERNPRCSDASSIMFYGLHEHLSKICNCNHEPTSSDCQDCLSSLEKVCDIFSFEN
jgi:hypothetical protein